MTLEPWQGKTVLVVDDSALVRERLRAQYEGLGMKVVAEATTGIEALAALQEHSPDVVSLDLIMPEMDGLEAFRAIKQINAKQLCIFVTWIGNDESVRHTIKQWVPEEAICGKPVSDYELRTALAAVYDFVDREDIHHRDNKEDTVDQILDINKAI